MDERKLFFYEKKLCFVCYEIDYVFKGCVKRCICKKCKKWYLMVLYIDGFIMSRESVGNKFQVKEVQFIVVSNGCIDVFKIVCDVMDCREIVVLYVIFLVKVKYKDSNKFVIMYVFYDNGSGGCFVIENIRR